MAVAVVVVVMAVVVVVMLVLRRYLVRLEQADAEEQRQGNVALGGAKDPGIVLHLTELLFHGLQPLFGDEVTLVQHQDVAVDHLGPPDLGVENALVEVLRIDQRDDRVQSRLVAQLAAEEGHRHRQRIGQASGLHDDVVQGLRTFKHPLHGLHQLVVDRAADAAVAQLHHLLSCGDDEFVINTDLPEFVHQHSGLHTLLIAENVIEQRCFSGTEKARENRHRNPNRG